MIIIINKIKILSYNVRGAGRKSNERFKGEHTTKDHYIDGKVNSSRAQDIIQNLKVRNYIEISSEGFS